jgi:thioredoxin reductase
MAESASYDVIVVGGGPAGLAAALWLARYRRTVRVFDAQDPRNAETWAVHGYLGLQDIPPFELRRVGRAQAADAGAELEAAVVERVEGEIDDFRVTLADGRTFRSRRVLLCTGLRDIIPEIPGLMDFYGTSIWHCPECDGPSATGKRIGVIGWGKSIVKYCMWMLTWTDRLVLLSHGRSAELPPEATEALERWGIPLRTEAIERLEGEDGQVRRVLFEGGSTEEVDALFFHIASGPGSTLPADLGCEADEEGILEVDNNFETTVPGVYAAGDITPGTRLAIRAAYEGTRAAIGIQKSLLPPERTV